MSTNKEIVVLSAVRTAIGTYGGSLAGTPPADLAAAVVREAVARAGVAPEPGTPLSSPSSGSSSSMPNNSCEY